MNSDLETLTMELRRLRLSGMAETLDIRIEEATARDLPYKDFLQALLLDEGQKRSGNVYNRRLRQACFPQLKTIDEFDFTFNPSPQKRDILELASCSFLLEKRNILFVGPPGVGKTHLAISIGISAISKGYEVVYRSIFELLEEMALSFAEGKRRHWIKKMIQVPLLIIDEFGMKEIPSTMSEDILEIFHRRYQQCSTVICTNRPIEDWGKILGDIPATTALLDRFLEGIHLVKITGKSYRLQGGVAQKQQASSDKKAEEV